MSRDLFFSDFGTRNISLEWTLLQTVNLVCRSHIEGLKQKNTQLGQNGRCIGHVTYC